MRSVTIGIPAYNEEKNIANLLRALEDQYSREMIQEVIISDDSSDRTPELVKRFAMHSSLPVTLLHHSRRRGAAAAWNEIFHRASSDTVILYDADVIPHPSCTLQLASQIEGPVALCASNSRPVEATGMAGRASRFVSDWLGSVRLAKMSRYTVMGRALSIDSAAAKRIVIPTDTIAIDLYLQCRVLEMGLEVVYDGGAIVYFRPATSMPDFASQIVRAVNGHGQLRDYASRFRIDLPVRTAAANVIKNAAKDPVGAASAAIGFVMMPYYRSKLTEAGVNSAKWQTAQTSKSIDYQQLRSSF